MISMELALLVINMMAVFVKKSHLFFVKYFFNHKKLDIITIIYALRFSSTKTILITYSTFRLPSAAFIGTSGIASSLSARQAVPCVIQSVSPSSRFMTGVAFRIHMASLIHIAFLLHSLSITFAPSHSLMQLFLSAWSFIAGLCSTVADSLFCFLVNRLVVMFSTSFLCSSNLVPNVLPVSLIYVWLQLLEGIWYTQAVFLLSSTLFFGCTSNILMF